MATQSPRRKSTRDFQKSLDQNLTDYTQETTIHGLKYLGGRNRSLPERIFWTTIFIVSMSCLGYFIYKICKAWMEHPIMIIDRNTPTQIFEIPYAAITICPAIKMKQDKFNVLSVSDEIQKLVNSSTFWDTDYGKKFIIASQICRRSFQKFSDPLLDEADVNLRDLLNNATIMPELIRTLYDTSPQRDEVIKLCRIFSWDWDDEAKLVKSNKNCESLFSPIITNEGVCFTFNTVHDVLRADSLHNDFKYYDIREERDGWDPDQGYTKHKVFPYKGMVKGSPAYVANGFKFVLVANMSDIAPNCEPFSLGYKLVFNSPAVYPHMYEKYISLEYGKEYKIAIIPKTIYTADDLRSFDPETRQCYFNDERRLRYFTFYNEVNCRLECYANFSLQTCGGVPFSSPRDSNAVNCVQLRRNFAWDLPEFYDSLNEYNKQFPIPADMLDPESNTNCNCLPECNSIRYEYEILKSYDDVGDVDQFNDTNNTSDIARTTVDIFFTQPHYIGQKRVRVYTFETLISDFGGLLGLFMGGSLLSFFELIYFLTIRNCFKQK